MSDKKLKFKLTFRSVLLTLNSEQIEAMECMQFPEIAIVRKKQRFEWKNRFIVRMEGVEYELPTLRDALVLVLQQKGIPAEAVTEELKKFIEEV